MKYLILGFFLVFVNLEIKSQCIEKYSWATWSNFNDSTATGYIKVGNKNISVKINTSGYKLRMSNYIYAYNYFFANFPGYNAIPDIRVPELDFKIGGNTITKFCFSEPVQDPILLISTLGNVNNYVTLNFSEPYIPFLDKGGITYNNNKSLIGIEGFGIIKFPGKINCITINTINGEYYSNLTFALPAPAYPVRIFGDTVNCNKVTLEARGGKSYKWNGGNTPNDSINTFNISGNYTLTSIDSNDCEVKINKNIRIDNNCLYGIIAPRIFTPDNDGINDTFRLYISDAVITEFNIYDRWGELVYDDISSEWDGKFNGKYCAKGSYVYVLKYNTNTNNTEKIYKGEIVLMR